MQFAFSSDPSLNGNAELSDRLSHLPKVGLRDQVEARHYGQPSITSSPQPRREATFSLTISRLSWMQNFTRFVV